MTTAHHPFTSVLIANRGEIAERIVREAKALGLRAIAVYSDADKRGLHVEEADAAIRIGPPPARDSYLNVEAILAAAKQTNAEAIHPGYGFLSEHPDFAQAVIDAVKKHTSLKIIEAIQSNNQESRKEWMLAMFKEAGQIKSNTSRYQFWQHESHPIELSSNEIMQQKLDYIHNNPVVTGFVNNPMDWRYSSARDYCGKKGFVEIKLIE